MIEICLFIMYERLSKINEFFSEIDILYDQHGAIVAPRCIRVRSCYFSTEFTASTKEIEYRL